MLINIKTKDFELPQELRQKVEEKTQSTLSKYLDRDDESVKCDIELGKAGSHSKSGDVFRAEINCTAYGTLVRGEETAETVDKAFEKTLKDTARQLRRRKSKENSLIKRGGARLKRMTRFGRR